MSYQLTDEQKQIIDAKVAAFCADFKVKVKGNHIILYVDSWRDHEDYPTDLGEFEDPQAVMQAILDYPGYANRSPVSAKRIQAEVLLEHEAEYRRRGLAHMYGELAKARRVLGE